MMLQEQSKVYRGLPWFGSEDEIYVLGSGGIGSFVTFGLARNGFNLSIQDKGYFEDRNSGGQLFLKKNLEETKVSALKKLCEKTLCTSRINILYGEYNDIFNPIMVICVDNPETRIQAFNVWKNQPSRKLFIDGRLEAESLWIYCVIRGREKRYEANIADLHEYHKESVNCTASQTTFAAMIIGGLITSYVCNYLVNKKQQAPVRAVPFETHKKLAHAITELES